MQTIKILPNYLFFLVVINTSFIFGTNSSIFEAIIRSDTNLVNYMLKNRADLNVTNSDGMSPLHIVSDPEMALNFIINGANINAKNRVGSTPLHWAVSRNYETIVQLLLEFGADVNIADNNGNTPLHFAVNSDENIILLLIRSGANVNAKNKKDSTPLVEALLKNKNNISKFLTLAGANDIKNKEALSPSILATLEKTPDVKQVLEANTLDPLIKSIFIENYPEATQLIQKGRPIDKVDVNGNTPLHWAFQKKNRYISRILLDKKAKFDVYNYSDQTPIDILLQTEDTNFIFYIQELLEDKTNFTKSFKNKRR